MVEHIHALTVSCGPDLQLDHVLIHEDTLVPVREDRPPHLVMVFSGRWNACGAGGQWPLAAGNALLHLRHTVLSIAATRGSEVVLLMMTAALATRFADLYEESNGPVRLSFDDLGGIPDALHRELHTRDDAMPAVVEGLTVQLLALGSRAAYGARRAAPSWFPRAARFIEANLASTLSVEIVSRAAGISASRLAHSFRGLTGHTFSAYVNEARVRAAAIALRTTENSLADIAASVGFYDQSHFSRTFKALKRSTPMEYRRTRKSDDGLEQSRHPSL